MECAEPTVFKKHYNSVTDLRGAHKNMLISTDSGLLALDKLPENKIS